jgi:hypothetical protein
MKKILGLALFSLASVASADWGGAVGGPVGYPQVCVQNRSAVTIQVYVNQQLRYIAPFQIQQVPVYNYNQALVALNTDQLRNRNRGNWAQRYVFPQQYGCVRSNTATIYQWGNVLGLQ